MICHEPQPRPRWVVVLLLLHPIIEHTIHTALDCSTLWSSHDRCLAPSIEWLASSDSASLHNCTRADSAYEGHVALLVRAVLVGVVEHRETHEVATVRERLVDGVGRGRRERVDTKPAGARTTPDTRRRDGYGTPSRRRPAWTQRRPRGGACRHGKSALYRLAVLLLDRIALKVLPDLAAAGVGVVPAARVHVKESIESQLIQPLDNMLCIEWWRRITRQY
jgi:hypothetical protein